MSGCGEHLIIELKPLELNAEFTDMLSKDVGKRGINGEASTVKLLQKHLSKQPEVTL